MQKVVLYVPDLAQYLGLTETSIRTHVYRCNWSVIPPPIRLGGRIAWRKIDVDNFLQEKADQSQVEEIKKGRGRPRKKRS